MKDFLLRLIKKPITWVILALILAIGVISIQAALIKKHKAEISRLEMNQEALLTDLQYYQDENGDMVARVNALTLRRDELETLIPRYTSEIETLKLKLKNVETLAHVSMETKAEVQTPTVTLQPPSIQKAEPDSPDPAVFPYTFTYNDDWLTITGTVFPDSLSNITVECRDSLTLVAHKTKKRCCRKSKIIKYDVQSKSPYSIIKDVSYVELIE